jgi:hypothetical protein
VSGNIISIHVGRQHIHLAEQLIGHGPIDKKNAQNKLFLIATARGYFSEIHHLVGSDHLPSDAEIQMPHHLSRSEQSMPILSPDYSWLFLLQSQMFRREAGGQRLGVIRVISRRHSRIIRANSRRLRRREIKQRPPPSHGKRTPLSRLVMSRSLPERGTGETRLVSLVSLVCLV